MIHDKIKAILARHPNGMSSASLCREALSSATPQDVAAIEIICMLSQDFTADGCHWRLAGRNRAGALVARLDNYATQTGKRLFRLSAALSGLSPHEYPTDDELRQALELAHGRYELLPNAMIKKNG
jgi:hypothetical protein